MSKNGKRSVNSVARDRKSRAAFTLIELMVSMGILGLIMVMLFSIFEQINKAWLQGENRVETFTQGRAILDLMSRELSQAIATTNIQFSGTSQSVFFVAPLNTDTNNQADLCEVGYVFDPVAFTFTRDFTAPTSANIASSAWNIYAPAWWSSGSFDKPIPLADSTNILSVTFEYFDPVAKNWVNTYTGNKLPSAIQIFMGVVDSRTATRLGLVPNVGTAWQSITNSTLRSFSTTVYLSNIYP